MKNKHMILAILIGVAFFTLLGVALAIFYGPSAYFFYTFFDSEQRQALKTTLTTREIVENFEPEGKKVKAFGYSIKVPWQEISNKTEDESSLNLIFSPNCVLNISNPKLNLNLYSDFQSRLGPQDSKHLSYFLEKFSNKFEFTVASFSASSEDYFIFRSYNEFLPLYCFLLNKIMYISFGTEFATRIYAFQTGNCKGFQIGDPALDKRIRLYLFADDGHDLEISISALELNQLKQKDIDKIILSFKQDV
jgi:hypothetical protein